MSCSVRTLQSITQDWLVTPCICGSAQLTNCRTIHLETFLIFVRFLRGARCFSKDLFSLNSQNFEFTSKITWGWKDKFGTLWKFVQVTLNNSRFRTLYTCLGFSYMTWQVRNFNSFINGSSYNFFAKIQRRNINLKRGNIFLWAFEQFSSITFEA